MGHVTKSGIWTPGEGEALDPEVYLAAMAGSIEEGIGERLDRQEQGVGLKASLPFETPITPELTPVAYEISNGFGDFNSGMVFSNGYATVQTSGMYIVTCAISTDEQDSIVAVQLHQNATICGYFEASSTVTGWASAVVNIALNCVPGDTIYAQAKVRDGGLSAMPTASYLSIVMVQTSL